MKTKKMIMGIGISVGVMALLIGTFSVMGNLYNHGVIRSALLDNLLLANKSRLEMREAKALNWNRTLKIGVAGPKEIMQKDTLFLQGVELAVADINAQKGILGMKLQAVVEDDRGSMTESLRIAQTFAVDPNCVAVIGHWTSGFTVPLAELYDATGVLLISPTATSPELTQNGYKTVFRTTASDSEIGRKMAGFAKQQGYQNVVIYYEDAVNGKSASMAFEQQVKARGLRIVDRHGHFANRDEFENAYKAWKTKGVDAVYIADTMRDSKEFVAWLRAKDRTLPILAGEGFNYKNLIDVVGTNAENIAFASFSANQKQGKSYESFKARFVKQYGVEPDYYALKGYESVAIVKQAIESAKSTSPMAMVHMLKSGKTFESVNGTLSFNESGEQALESVVVKKVINGQIVTVTP